MSTFATQPTPDAGGPSGARIEVHINNQPSSVAVVLRHDDPAVGGAAASSRCATRGAARPLRRHGPQWEPCDVHGKTLQYPVRLEALQRGSPCCRATACLSASRKISSCATTSSRSPSSRTSSPPRAGRSAHHLFCEFFDNSIESLLRTRCARPDAWGGRPPPPIELHLVLERSGPPRHAGAHRGARLRQRPQRAGAEGVCTSARPADERAAVIRGASALSAQLEELSTKHLPKVQRLVPRPTASSASSASPRSIWRASTTATASASSRRPSATASPRCAARPLPARPPPPAHRAPPRRRRRVAGLVLDTDEMARGRGGRRQLGRPQSPLARRRRRRSHGVLDREGTAVRAGARVLRRADESDHCACFLLGKMDPPDRRAPRVTRSRADRLAGF